MDFVDPDPLRGASHRSVFAHLSGPFTGGAVEVPLVLDANGRSAAAVDLREPLVVVSPRCPLAADLSGEGDGTAAPVVLTFAPYTDSGSFVPAGRRQSTPSRVAPLHSS
jgi:hypothetical protein